MLIEMSIMGRSRVLINTRPQLPEVHEALPGGGRRSLVGIVKCLLLAFCQGFMSLSEIERHTFVLVRHLSLFHLGAVATFWPMTLVGIYPGRTSHMIRRSLIEFYLGHEVELFRKLTNLLQ